MVSNNPRTPPVLRRALATLVGLALVIGSTLTAQGAAMASGPAQLSGTVTLDSADGAPAVGVIVQAYEILGPEDLGLIADTRTAPDGSYSLDLYAPGRFTIITRPAAGDGRAPAIVEDFPVTSDTDLDLTQVVGATLSGTVLSPSASPVPGAEVYVALHGTGSTVSQETTTDSEGAFQLAQLPAGDFTLTGTSDDFDPVWVPVTLAPSEAKAGFSVQLLAHATISGRVTSSIDADQGIGGIVVTRDGVSTTTATDGSWILTGDQRQPFGSGTLAFSDPTQAYLPQWWKGASTESAANGIRLDPGEQATGYDARLVPAGTVSGKVTSFGDGIGIAGVSVSVTGPDSAIAGSRVISDAAGNYSVRGVPAGTYSVNFYKSGSGFLGTSVAGVVVLRGKSVTTDAVLDRASAIVGKVTFEGDGPVDLTAVRLRMTGQTVRPDAQGNFTFTGLAGGTYKFEVIPDDQTTYVSRWYVNGTDPSNATPVVVKANEPPTRADVVVPLQVYPKTTRVSGADRYAVAVSVSKKTFPGGAPTVYVATGETYPDALSAGAAAVTQGGPLLMTPKNTLPAEVKAEIQRLKPANIVVVGGPNSVSPAVFDALKKLQSKTTRVDGADRFAVSRELALDVFGDGGADVVYIATGLNFPDALGASGAAGFQGGPVLLVNGQAGTLDAATKTALDTLDPGKIVIAGGPASVSTGIENALKAYGPVQRLGGADRYEASVAINLNAYTSSDEAFLVTGSTFPDALSGSAWAGHLGAPLYVSRPDCVPQVTLDALHKQGVKKLILIGGPNSLSADVLALKPCS
ncbi:cell wall-binding repeat-containing protein [Herbiconiux sp.]|uniref:cell wall-binding repeat-containing protein n=1 Tax=Herbiconiux sp. TaxID=1871186 RepID=UPI0025BD50E1|nr:cell wall-binding repeat-containing protein [Herbiconiux sp.]